MELVAISGQKIELNTRDEAKFMEQIREQIWHLSNHSAELAELFYQHEANKKDFITIANISDQALATGKNLPFAALVIYISIFISILEQQLKT